MEREEFIAEFVINYMAEVDVDWLMAQSKERRDDLAENIARAALYAWQVSQKALSMVDLSGSEH